jgi:hypothetical protein
VDSAGDRVEQTEPPWTAESAIPAMPPQSAAPGQATETAKVAGEQPPVLAKWLAIYTLLRLAMLVALAGVLSLVMPFILAALFAVILALPLSWLLFGGVRRRVNAGLARSNAARRTERERLRSALNGEDLR